MFDAGLDLAVLRRVPLAPGQAVDLRVEVFNVFNTPQFGAPNGTFGSAFGSITTAADPRVVQVAIKYVF